MLRRAWSRFPDPRLDGPGFAAALALGAERVGARAVLPGTEAALLALAGKEAQFPDGVKLGTCSPTVTARATDKLAALGAAATVGIDVLSLRVLSRGDCTRAVSYPAVVKPLRSELEVGGALRRFEVRRVSGPEQLERALSLLPEGVAIVQPYVEGSLVTFNGVAWRGEVVASVHKRAQRTWPTDCGAVCAAMTVAPDRDLERQSERLMAELAWSGPFNLQFLENAAGRYLIDINPRIYTSLALAVAAGANLPAIWVERLVGGRPSRPTYRTGVRFRSEDDLRAVARLVTSGDRRSALRGVVPHRRTVHGFVSARDPMPTLAFLRRALRRSRLTR